MHIFLMIPLSIICVLSIMAFRKVGWAIFTLKCVFLFSIVGGLISVEAFVFCFFLGLVAGPLFFLASK